VVEDLVRGHVSFDNAEIDDFVIARSDGTPTYNLVAVVDDAHMGITHVIRGDDHLNNTPKQVLLYRALGWDPPRFAHLPMILGPDRSKLSKRHGAVDVLEYRRQGYLPEALVNYLARLGWSWGNQEIFSREELIERFDLDRVGRAPAAFDPEKLLWVNAHWLRAADPERLLAQLRPFLEERGCRLEEGRGRLLKLLEPLRERCRTLRELAEAAEFLFHHPGYDPRARERFLRPEARERLGALLGRLRELQDFRAPALERLFRELCERWSLHLRELAQPVRVALTGRSASPPLFEVMEALGREETLRRLEAALREP